MSRKIYKKKTIIDTNFFSDKLFSLLVKNIMKNGNISIATKIVNYLYNQLHIHLNKNPAVVLELALLKVSSSLSKKNLDIKRNEKIYNRFEILKRSIKSIVKCARKKKNKVFQEALYQEILSIYKN